MQGKTRQAVPHIHRRTSFRRDSHAGNARTAFERPYEFDDFLVNRGQTEKYVALLYSVRNPDCAGQDDSFQDNA